MPLTPQNLADINEKNEELSTDQIPVLKVIEDRQTERLATVTDLDNAYKVLFNDVNAEINSYNTELQKLDCLVKVAVTEDMLVNAAEDERVTPADNPLFHNNTTYLRRYLFPYIKTVGIGLPHTGGAQSTTECVGNRKALVDSAISTFTSSGTVAQEATGQQCTGVSPNFVVTNTTVVNAMNSLKTAVSNYRTFLNAFKNDIYITSDNASRNSEGQTARNNIDTTIAAIDAWTNLPDFASVATTTTCAVFNAITFSNTKGSTTNLNTLQTALNTQTTNNTTRINQLVSYLGNTTTIVQNDTTWGLIPHLTTSEYQLLYYKRAILMNARVGRPMGSLRLIKEITRDRDDQIRARSTLFTVLSVSRYL